MKIGFDGYGYGGYTVCDDGCQDLDMAKYVAELIPDEFPKFALGSGKPIDIVKLSEFGWDIFDCVLPTRDARHQRLYNFKKWPKEKSDIVEKENYQNIYLSRGRFSIQTNPANEKCDCKFCRNFSLGYLRHLFKINDTTAMRLATIHNLCLYSKVIEIIRKNSSGTKETTKI